MWQYLFCHKAEQQIAYGLQCAGQFSLVLVHSQGLQTAHLHLHIFAKPPKTISSLYQQGGCAVTPSKGMKNRQTVWT